MILVSLNLLTFVSLDSTFCRSSKSANSGGNSSSALRFWFPELSLLVDPLLNSSVWPLKESSSFPAPGKVVASSASLEEGHQRYFDHF